MLGANIPPCNIQLKIRLSPLSKTPPRNALCSIIKLRSLDNSADQILSLLEDSVFDITSTKTNNALKINFQWWYGYYNNTDRGYEHRMAFDTGKYESAW